MDRSEPLLPHFMLKGCVIRANFGATPFLYVRGGEGKGGGGDEEGTRRGGEEERRRREEESSKIIF